MKCLKVKLKVKKTLILLFIMLFSVFATNIFVFASDIMEISFEAETESSTLKISEETTEEYTIEYTEEYTEPATLVEQGSGTVQSYTEDGEKEFYTIISENGSTFYLVIDTEKNSQNVYFLKAVDEIDLLQLVGEQITYVDILVETTEATTEEVTQTTTQSFQSFEEVLAENTTIGLTEIAVIAIVVFGIGFLIYNKKKGKTSAKNKNSNNLLFDEYEEEKEEKEDSIIGLKKDKDNAKEEQEIIDGIQNMQNMTEDDL